MYGKVVGVVWATERVSSIKQTSLKLVAPCVPGTGEQTGPAILAVDVVGCRIDDQVLVVSEGSSTRFLLGDKTSPLDAVVVGVVDTLDVERSS